MKIFEDVAHMKVAERSHRKLSRHARRHLQRAQARQVKQKDEYEQSNWGCSGRKGAGVLLMTLRRAFGGVRIFTPIGSLAAT